MRSVRTTFQILEAVADNQPVGLSELARRLGLPKSTVQRSLSTLADLGWIRPHGQTQTRWMLGERVRSLSERVDDLGRLREAAMPTLGQLNTETLETVHMAVREARTVRLVERLDSKHPLRLVKPIGSRSALHAGSTGKSILAYLPEDEVETYVAGGLEPATSNTITNPDALRTELKLIRELGYAVSNEELTEGIVSVAASIRPPDSYYPIAAISVSGPTMRMTPELRHQYGAKVIAASATVSERLRG